MALAIASEYRKRMKSRKTETAKEREVFSTLSLSLCMFYRATGCALVFRRRQWCMGRRGSLRETAMGDSTRYIRPADWSFLCVYIHHRAQDR